MWDYLYLWHQPDSKQLVASGIEFRDIFPDLMPTNLILLRHDYMDWVYEPASRFTYVPADELAKLAAADIESYGDFSWVDFPHLAALAKLSDPAIAELAFFSHMTRPLQNVQIPGLANRFLCYAHDDGWYAKIFYHDWIDLAMILGRLLQNIVDPDKAVDTLNLLRRGVDAFWCQAGSVVPCEPTADVDAVVRKFLRPER